MKKIYSILSAVALAAFVSASAATPAVKATSIQEKAQLAAPATELKAEKVSNEVVRKTTDKAVTRAEGEAVTVNDIEGLYKHTMYTQNGMESSPYIAQFAQAEGNMMDIHSLFGFGFDIQAEFNPADNSIRIPAGQILEEAPSHPVLKVPYKLVFAVINMTVNAAGTQYETIEADLNEDILLNYNAETREYDFGPYTNENGIYNKRIAMIDLIQNAKGEWEWGGYVFGGISAYEVYWNMINTQMGWEFLNETESDPLTTTYCYAEMVGADLVVSNMYDAGFDSPILFTLDASSADASQGVLGTATATDQTFGKINVSETSTPELEDLYFAVPIFSETTGELEDLTQEVPFTVLEYPVTPEDGSAPYTMYPMVTDYSMIMSLPGTYVIKIWAGLDANGDPNPEKQSIFQYTQVMLEFNPFDPEAGIKNVTVSDNSNAPVEYYNLQGVRLAEPTKGEVIILRQGNKARKVLVK